MVGVPEHQILQDDKIKQFKMDRIGGGQVDADKR